jgi:hypothetical protein
MEAEAAFRVVDRPQHVTPSSKRPLHSLTSFFSASSPAIGVEAVAGAAAAAMTTTEGKEAAASRPQRATRPA